MSASLGRETCLSSPLLLLIICYVFLVTNERYVMGWFDTLLS